MHRTTFACSSEPLGGRGDWPRSRPLLSDDLRGSGPTSVPFTSVTRAAGRSPRPRVIEAVASEPRLHGAVSHCTRQGTPRGVETLEQSQSPFAGYSEGEPLAAYAALTATFNAGMIVALVAAARRGRLPERVGFNDVASMALATHKIARLLTKDSVTSFLRAPFVRLEEKGGTNSVEETPRGRGVQRALGELLSCPECTGQWVAAGLLVGMLHGPRTTRAITSLYSALALGDLLQFVYTGLKSRA